MEVNITNRDKLILRELSANSRTSLTKLAKVAGCSVATANKLLERLVERLDVRFTLEIDLDKLGFSERHIILVRFAKKPDYAFLQNLFKEDPYAQDVYLTEGGYSLLIFAAADTSGNYIKWETDLMVNLSDYVPQLRPSEYIFAHLGYMPLNSSFVNFIKKEIKIDKKDRLILQLLNENSRLGYREMSKRLGIKEDTIRYRVFKLLHNGVILRFTIAVQNAGGSVNAYFVRYNFDKYTLGNIFPLQRKHSMSESEEMPLINRTPTLVIMSGSYRFFAMAYGNTNSEALSAGVRWHVNLLKNNNPEAVNAFVVKTIKGLLPLRNIDAKTHYKLLWT